MTYNNLSREKVLEIYRFVMDKRKDDLGQRNIYRLVKEKFENEISENTISSWIFYDRKPFGSEKTQFKSIPKPLKEELLELYINQKQSAQKLAKKYDVSTIIVINWLKDYSIKPRTHLESMNTDHIKLELSEQKIRRPTKEFFEMTKEKAYLLGVLCGDGCLCHNSIRLEIRYDEEFIKEFSRCLKEVYGLDYHYHYYSKRNSFVLYASSKIICEDLSRYGKFGTFEWKIPKEILNDSNGKFACGFLKGLFDSEGSASRYVISMSSANKTGIILASKLLSQLKIQNKVITTKRGYYILYITKRERLKSFKEKIGFTIKRKLEKLEYLK